MKAATKTNRLQRIKNLLKDRKQYSTRDIIQRAHVCAVSAAISACRNKGMNIICQRKGNIWFYRMA